MTQIKRLLLSLLLPYQVANPSPGLSLQSKVTVEGREAKSDGGDQRCGNKSGQAWLGKKSSLKLQQTLAVKEGNHVEGSGDHVLLWDFTIGPLHLQLMSDFLRLKNAIHYKRSKEILESSDTQGKW